MAVVPQSDARALVLSRAAQGAWLPNWPLWIGLAAFARLMAQPAALLNDPDTYLHIAAGRWMLAHVALPSADPFSYTMAGAGWIPGEWLAEVGLAALYDAAGWGGVVAASAACVAVSFGLLCRFLVQRVGAVPAAMLTLAGLPLVLPHVVARPHLLAMPVLAWWTGALFAVRDEGGTPDWRLLPLMTLWANLHASFLVGLGLVVWLGVEAVWSVAPVGRRAVAVRWGGFGVAALGAALLTPNGPSVFVQPLRLMAMPALQASFGEWLPPDFAAFPALEAWLLAALALGFGLRVRLGGLRLALLLVVVHMALRHVRHADLLAFVAPPAIASGLAAALEPYRERLAALTLWRGADRLAGSVRLPAATLTVALAVFTALPVLYRPMIRDDGPTTPAAALSAARNMGVTGRVFNGEGFGGYLIFAGVADFIDGRVELFGNEFLADDVAAERGDPAVLGRLLDRYAVAWTLLAPEAGAVGALDRMPGWRRLYADRHAVVHVRTSTPPG